MTPNGDDPIRGGIGQVKPTSDTASPGRAGKLSGWSSRKQMLIWGGVTVAVLAVVIMVLAAVAPWRVKPSADNDQILSKLAYARALEEEGSGETTAAIDSLQKAVALDPDNTAAAKKLDELKVSLSKQASNGTSPTNESNSGSSGDSSTNPEKDPKRDPKKDPPQDFDKGWLDPVDDLKALLPSQAAGYRLGYPDGTQSDMTRSGTPLRSKGESGVLWAVHDAGSPTKAKRFVEKTTKYLYSKDSASVNVDGVPAYFGTDGTRFASVAWSRGRFAFEVIVTTTSSPPKSLKTVAVTASEAFPDAP